ncbi:hypothetical protein SAMN05421504_106251 [Amycolatopsis xylanica]|uniref:Uncharacterized protein n=1 Tax=Amycolatopsis xylanica TaxID=589385 RepID=A0A1H3LKD0_9PSEU|nr:hypothetical protein [Amycolatopsis xylanica]SDY64796.1 hypothetical protein SAMN05421504_106251 [Amycolatopsis xylanica]
MSEQTGSDLTRAAENAITYARRVAGTARAQRERHREENKELIKEFGKRRLAGSATKPTPPAVSEAAQRFRFATGNPVPEFPSANELVPPRPPRPPKPPRSSDDDEDFSQARIMIRGD